MWTATFGPHDCVELNSFHSTLPSTDWKTHVLGCIILPCCKFFPKAGRRWGRASPLSLLQRPRSFRPLLRQSQMGSTSRWPGRPGWATRRTPTVCRVMEKRHCDVVQFTNNGRRACSACKFKSTAIAPFGLSTRSNSFNIARYRESRPPWASNCLSHGGTVMSLSTDESGNGSPWSFATSATCISSSTRKCRWFSRQASSCSVLVSQPI